MKLINVTQAQFKKAMNLPNITAIPDGHGHTLYHRTAGNDLGLYAGESDNFKGCEEYLIDSLIATQLGV